MKAIEILSREHRLVWRLLQCLRRLVEDTRFGVVPGRSATEEVLSLFEWFVESSHQDKEEQHLFPRLLARSGLDERRRLERLFDDHAAERRRLMGMRLHVEGACQGSSISLDRFAAHAWTYMRLQRDHVVEEDRFVLPLAEALLSPEDDRLIVHGFEQVDARFRHVGDVEGRVAALCEDLAIAPLDEDAVLHLLAWT